MSTAISTLPTTRVPSSLPPAVPPANPAPVKRISVADRVARAFPPLACVRGFRYFARRRVALSNVSESMVDAEVKGKRTQHVRLRVEDGRFASACTCAAKLLGPATCRHVWATLLEVDRQCALESLRSTHRSLALGRLEGPQPRRKRPSSEAAPATPTIAPTKRPRKSGRT